jgi:hypothetical protein
MNQLKSKKPKEFQTINALIQNNGDPQPLIQQIMSGITPEQKENILRQAKGYGCPSELLTKLQNMK